MIKEKILLFTLFTLAVASFSFPFVASSLQNTILEETEKFVEINGYKSENNQESLPNSTNDLSIIYEVITFGTKTMQNIIEYTDTSPSELFILVNEEIEWLQDQYILPKTQFRLLDTPTIFTYKSKENGSILVWEYYFFDDESNILKFLFHPSTGKILWLDYENIKIQEDNDWIVEYYSPYIDEPNTFSYTGTRMLAILDTPPQIFKTQIRLFNTGYTVTVHKKTS